MPELYSELGRRAARAISRMAGRDSHRQSRPWRAISASTRSARIAYSTATIECRLLRFDLNEASEPRTPEAARADWSTPARRADVRQPVAQEPRRASSLGRERERIDCFRLYDADMPEYAFAIDLYGRDAAARLPAGYAPPKTVDQESARERRREVLAALPQVLQVPLEQIHSRVRKPQKGTEQYEKRALDAGRMAVRGSGARVLGEFSRLSGHGTVPRSPYHPQHAARVGRGMRISSICSATREAPRCMPPPAVRARA